MSDDVDSGTGAPTPLRRDPVAHVRLDGVEQRLETAEDVIAALSRIPERVAAIEAVAEAAADNAKATRQDVHALRLENADHFARIHRAHEQAREREQPPVTPAQLQAALPAPPSRFERFKDTLAVLIPVLLALIAAWVTVQTTSKPDTPAPTTTTQTQPK